MDAQQLIILAVAVSVALLALIGAIATWRVLQRTGHGLRVASDSLSARARTLPTTLVSVRTQVASVDIEAEHAIWMLGNLDDRLDRASADLRAKRLTSDSLRLRLIDGRLTIARMKQLVRLLIRLGELRRDFL